MTDPDLFTAAATAAGYESTGRFAADVLSVDPRNARRWKSGEQPMQSTARLVCAAIITRPALARELANVLEVARDNTLLIAWIIPNGAPPYLQEIDSRARADLRAAGYQPYLVEWHPSSGPGERRMIYSQRVPRTEDVAIALKGVEGAPESGWSVYDEEGNLV